MCNYETNETKISAHLKRLAYPLNQQLYGPHCRLLPDFPAVSGEMVFFCHGTALYVTANVDETDRLPAS